MNTLTKGFAEGDRVIVVGRSRKANYGDTLGKIGIIKQCHMQQMLGGHSVEVGVQLEDMYNPASTKGLFWIKQQYLQLINEKNTENENGGFNMEGNFKIAIVNLLEDRYKNDYGFALFDEAVVGDTVVVDSCSKQCLGTVKQILTQEGYGKSVTKEVIAVVDLRAYKAREEERERLIKVEKEKNALKKELDKRIKKLQDVAFYEKMAMSLQLQDPELVAMVNKLKELSK